VLLNQPVPHRRYDASRLGATRSLRNRFISFLPAISRAFCPTALPYSYVPWFRLLDEENSLLPFAAVDFLPRPCWLGPDAELDLWVVRPCCGS